MTEIPPAAPPAAENPFWATLRQPRVVLILLAVWEIIGALTEFFTSSGLFVNLHGRELDGALGGRALGWEAVPLAVLYLYCARDPARYHHVFWLALIEQAAAIVGRQRTWMSMFWRASLNCSGSSASACRTRRSKSLRRMGYQPLSHSV